MVAVEIYEGLRVVEKLETVGSFYELPDRKPFYIEFSSCMIHEEVRIKSIHCWRIKLEPDGLGIFPQNISLKFTRSRTARKVILTTPTFQPIPDELNLIYHNEESLHPIGIYLFRLDSTKGSPIFHSAAFSIACDYYLPRWIKDEIFAVERRSGEIKLAVLTDSQMTPEFKSLDEVITKSFLRTCPRLLVILAVATRHKVTIKIGDRRYNSSKIPIYPQILMKWAIEMLDKCSETKRWIFNHLIRVGVNGGIPIDVLDLIPSPTAEESRFKSDHFDKVVLNLCKDSVDVRTLKRILKVPLYNLSCMQTDVNEATLIHHFWCGVLGGLLWNGLKVDYGLALDWSTRLFLPKDPESTVDLCVLIQLTNEASVIPIILVEWGKDTFDFDDKQQHLNRSKLFQVMSSSCIEIAHRLVDLNKDPESARVYGVFIGGLEIQLCVARAVVKEDTSNYSIHAEITCRKHWYMNLFDNKEGGRGGGGGEEDCQCREACCWNVNPANDEIESLESAKETFDVLQFEREAFANHTNQKITLKSECQKEPKKEEMSKLFRCPRFDIESLDYKSIQKLERFLHGAKQYIKKLKTTDSPTNPFTKFKFKRYFYLSSFWSLHSNCSSTDSQKEIPTSRPAKKSKHTTSTSSDPSQFTIIKHSFPELNLYRRLWAYFPSYFARIYEVVPRYDESKDEWTISYTFEKLLPLVEFRGYDKRLSNIIWRRSLIASIKAATKLAIDVLFELHLLHKQLGMIHCDLSFGNIMFSEEDCIWKIIDFNLSKPVDECLRVCKFRGGTEPFIAPECKSQGFYSEASDIFSLGSVILHAFLNCFRMRYEDYEPGSQIEKLTDDYAVIIRRMIDSKTESRPTVLEALRSFLGLLRKIVPDPDDPIYGEPIMNNINLLFAMK